MRIRICAPRENGKGNFRLFLPVPLGIAKWRFIWNHLPAEQRIWADLAPALVDAIRQYKRENGSWDLVEVHCPKDNTHVTIRV